MAPMPPSLTEWRIEQLKKEAKNKRHVFAWNLVYIDDIFSKPEKLNRNVNGGGKEFKAGLDPSKVALVKYLAFRHVKPAKGTASKQAANWQACVTHINKGLLRHYNTGKEKKNE